MASNFFFFFLDSNSYSSATICLMHPITRLLYYHVQIIASVVVIWLGLGQSQRHRHHRAKTVLYSKYNNIIIAMELRAWLAQARHRASTELSRTVWFMGIWFGMIYMLLLLLFRCHCPCRAFNSFFIHSFIVAPFQPRESCGVFKWHWTKHRPHIFAHRYSVEARRVGGVHRGCQGVQWRKL